MAINSLCILFCLGQSVSLSLSIFVSVLLSVVPLLSRQSSYYSCYYSCFSLFLIVFSLLFPLRHNLCEERVWCQSGSGVKAVTTWLTFGKIFRRVLNYPIRLIAKIAWKQHSIK